MEGPLQKLRGERANAVNQTGVIAVLAIFSFHPSVRLSVYTFELLQTIWSLLSNDDGKFMQMS